MRHGLLTSHLGVVQILFASSVLATLEVIVLIGIQVGAAVTWTVHSNGMFYALFGFRCSPSDEDLENRNNPCPVGKPFPIDTNDLRAEPVLTRGLLP
jgi:hypothetical protein